MNLQPNFYCTGRFPQRSRRFYTEEQGLPGRHVLDIAFDRKGRLWAGTALGLARLDGDRFTAICMEGAEVQPAVSMVFCDTQGRLWAAAENRLFCIDEDTASVSGTFPGHVTAMADDGTGGLWLLTTGALYCGQPEGWAKVLEVQGTGRNIAAFGGGNVYVGTDQGLLALAGKRMHWFTIRTETSGLVSNRIQCLSFDGCGHLWIGTDRGVCIYDGTDHWMMANGWKSLPNNDIRRIVTGVDGSRYFAAPEGLIHLNNGVVKYYGYKRWLPDRKVNAVAVSPLDGTLWAATKEGLSRIATSWMTLEEKAAHYQSTVEAYHVRNGFVTIRMLEREGELSSGQVDISDNDGLWTACYAAAQTFRYAVTGSPEALELARRSIQAMLKLTRITNIPGFTARAIRCKGEAGFGNGHPEWHRTEDGQWEWKGDTSSDEMVGHFYAYSLYYDLAASDEEKEILRKVIRGITDHILENGYRLLDVDGIHTTWAVWSPEKINHDHKWVFEHGVNSLEILSYLKTAGHVTGDEAYQTAYRELVTRHHYAMNTARYKIEQHFSHIDDELAFLSMVPLLRYEKDPDLRAYYLTGLEHHWQYERIERTPLWNIIYGGLSGRPCDLEAAVQSLAELPLDLIDWPVFNSHRADLDWASAVEESGMREQLKAPLPYDEKPIGKYDANPFLADHGSGMQAEDGTLFLHPYWMARYFGLIKEYL